MELVEIGEATYKLKVINPNSNIKNIRLTEYIHQRYWRVCFYCYIYNTDIVNKILNRKLLISNFVEEQKIHHTNSSIAQLLKETREIRRIMIPSPRYIDYIPIRYKTSIVGYGVESIRWEENIFSLPCRYPYQDMRHSDCKQMTLLQEIFSVLNMGLDSINYKHYWKVSFYHYIDNLFIANKTLHRKLLINNFIEEQKIDRINRTRRLLMEQMAKELREEGKEVHIFTSGNRYEPQPIQWKRTLIISPSYIISQCREVEPLDYIQL